MNVNRKTVNIRVHMYPLELLYHVNFTIEHVQSNK